MPQGSQPASNACTLHLTTDPHQLGSGTAVGVKKITMVVMVVGAIQWVLLQTQLLSLQVTWDASIRMPCLWPIVCPSRAMRQCCAETHLVVREPGQGKFNQARMNKQSDAESVTHSAYVQKPSRVYLHKHTTLAGWLAHPRRREQSVREPSRSWDSCSKVHLWRKQVAALAM